MNYRENTLLRHGLAIAIVIGLAYANGFAQVAQVASDSAALTTEARKLETEDPDLEEKVQDYKVSIALEEPMRLSDFLELIQEQNPPLNILVRRNTGSILIPPMQLSNVSVQAVLNALEASTNGEILWHFGDEKEVIYIGRDDSRDSVKVVNVSRILEDTKEASLLSAIEIGLQMRESSKKNVLIKLHQETKLLFVKGVSDDLNVIMQIIAELGGETWPQPGGGATRGGGGS